MKNEKIFINVLNFIPDKIVQKRKIKLSISEKDFYDLKKAGFKNIEKVEMTRRKIEELAEDYAVFPNIAKEWLNWNRKMKY